MRAQKHHGNPMADTLDDRHVVADEQVGQPELLLQVEHEVDDLRLDRDVEGRDGLVGDDDLRVEGKRAGDAQALPLAAGEFMREACGLPGIEADPVHQMGDPLAGFRSRRASVHQDRLRDGGAHGLAGIEGSERVLEDHLDPAAGFLQGGTGARQDVATAEAHGSGRGFDEAKDAAPRRGFTAARFADEREGLTRRAP